LSDQLGHATVAQTLDVYAHLMAERHAGAVDVLDRYLI
jgi:integrase